MRARVGVAAYDFAVGTLNALERAGHKVPPFAREVEGFAEARLPRVGCDPAVHEELEAPGDASVDGQVAVQELAGPPIADRDAAPVPHVVLGVVRNVNAVAPTFRARWLFSRWPDGMRHARFVIFHRQPSSMEAVGFPAAAWVVTRELGWIRSA
jgi:hypothetical protein